MYCHFLWFTVYIHVYCIDLQLTLTVLALFSIIKMLI